MTTTSPLGVQARVTGPVSGQLAVGNNIVQYNVAAGAVVYHGQPGEIPVPRLRPRVTIKGRSPRLVGRARELEAAIEFLAPDSPVELHGEPGVGKSVLLKHLGHHAPADLASAVTYHSCGVETVEETLQFLYEAFYETPGPLKPVGGELWVLLAEVRGLVALDDLTLDRSQLDTILDALPEATFLLASERRRLWGPGRSLAVRGLEDDEAVALLEHKLGRPVPGDEQVAARDACRALEGHPLRVEQLATLVDLLGEPVADVAPRGDDGPPADVLVGRLKSKLGPEQLEVLAALTAVLGASLSAEHLGSLVGAPDIAAVVEPLLRTGLVQAHSPRYSLREPKAAVADGADWTHRVADHLATVAEEDADPEPVAEEAGAILTLLGRLRDDGDHPALLRLSGATERALMLGRRWGAWQVALQDQLAAARALDDPGSEAWALHQLGTRSLCLGDETAAAAFLEEALALREALGDRIGAEGTRHNLDLLSGPPPAPPTGPEPRPQWPPRPPAAPPPAAPPGPASRRRPLGLWGAAGAVVLLLVIGLVATLAEPGPDPENIVQGGPSTTRGPGTTAASGTPQTTQPSPVPTGGLGALPASLRFEDQPVGTASLPRTVTFTNTTGAPLRPTGATFEGQEAFSVAGGTCAGATVPDRGRCTLDVVFRPRTVGDRSATLRLAAPGAPAVAVAGRGVDSAVGEVRLDPGVVTFADQQVGSGGLGVTVRVTNVSSSPVTVQKASVSGPDDFAVNATGCLGQSLARGTGCALIVAFRPAAEGDRRAALLVTTSAGALPGSLQGRGLAAPSTSPGPTTTTCCTVSTQVILVAPYADLAVTVTRSNCPANLCEVNVTVTNNGPAQATGVKLTFSPPSAVNQHLDSRCSGNTCDLGTVGPSAKTTVALLVDLAQGPVASVTSQQNESASGNNKATL